MKMLKKWGILLIIIFFILVIGILCMLGMSSINVYKATIEEQNSQLATMEASLQNIGELINGYVVTREVRPGEQITIDNIDELIEEVSVPAKLNLGLALAEDESEEGEAIGDTTIVQIKENLINKYFKVGLVEGTVITESAIATEKLDNTWRYYDVLLDEAPIGVKVGDYIDIRIAFPFGEDFIAMSHKLIKEINSGILKLVLDENDIMIYNSMLLDKALYSGAKIYAVEYVDGGVQTKAEQFYPVQTNLSEITILDPNILEEVKQEMLLKREVLDNAIGGTIDEKTEAELAVVQSNINSTRNRSQSSIQSAQAALEVRLEAEARAAAAAAASQN